MKWYIPIGLTLLLTGSADWAARAMNNDAYLHCAGSSYVQEVHAYRQWVRAECRDLLMMEVGALMAEGDYAAARARLRDNYPGLVTFDIIDQAGDDPTGILATPFGCE